MIREIVAQMAKEETLNWPEAVVLSILIIGILVVFGIAIWRNS